MTPAVPEDVDDKVHPVRPDEKGLFKIQEDLEHISPSDFYRRVKSSRVTVIGIFGKTSLSESRLEKGFLFDDFIQRDVFRIADSEKADGDSDSKPSIFGFHDERSKRIFLHLFAPSFVARAFNEDLSTDEFRSFISGQQFSDAKLLLFLFHVCHVLVCYHPGHTIDISYISLFQVLDSLRLKLQSVVADQLHSLKLDLGKEWLNQGRVTQPRMLFYFASCPTVLRGSAGVSDLVKRDGTVSKHKPIVKLEFSLEDQIYKIYRKAGIVSTVGTNCLFSLPTRDGYVYVNHNADEGDVGDPIIKSMNHLFKSYGGLREDPDSNGPFVPFFYSQSIIESRSGSRCFSRFLSTQIDAVTVVAKNIDSSSDRRSIEIPTSEQWYSCVSALLPFFVRGRNVSNSGPDVSETVRSTNATLSAFTDIDLRFSEARCAKALPIAFTAYKDGLPAHYREEHHNKMLMQTLAIFSTQARGPASGRYAEKLVNECTVYWQSGRQMCEQTSLTGNSCTNRKHVTSDEQVKKEEEEQETEKAKKIYPTMSHNSGLVFLSACNCGRRQADRNDPFNLIDANFNFYVELAEDCCNALENIQIPVASASKTPRSSTSVGVEKCDTNDQFEKLQTLASAASKILDSPASEDSEFTANMVTKDTKPGLRPLFSSWALTQLGSAHLYAHSCGVNQPGFMSASKTLFSWDVPLKNIDWGLLQEKWPNLADYATKRPSFNKLAKGVDMGLTVKVFIGLEYECRRGHRFLSSSEKSSKTKATSTTAKAMTSDVPLYLLCPCRASSSSRPLTAQLMRIHVVTPKAPLHVTLFPFVSPSQFGPVFHPGWSEPVKLPINSYWVLRLPFIYKSDDICHVPPKDVPSSSQSRLLKGFIGISEDFSYN